MRLVRVILVVVFLFGWPEAFARDVLAEKTGVVGELEVYRDMDGRCVLPRDVIVWTPPGYETETDRRYPVLYMHDGQNVFDPDSSYIGVEWQADETVARLVEEGAIEPMIVVGLTNTRMRTKEYSPGPRGRGYMTFLVETVKPMIDENYRTKPGKAHTFTVGSSMGGLIACMLGWAYQDVFGAVMCFSPAFKVKGQADWSRFFTQSESRPHDVFFYVYNGGVGLEARLQPGIDEMLAFWERLGLRRGEDFTLVLDAEAEHNESAWAGQLPGALVRSIEEATRD